MAGAASELVLALDEGTTSARSIVFDRAGSVVAIAQREFEQRYPAPGDVRHDPESIWEAQLATAREAIAASGGVERIAAIGVTNQRETAVIWDRATGRAVADAIVWQSRVTAPFCTTLRDLGHEALVRERTGLPIDAYFSGPKLRQILVEDPPLRARAERGELAAGTVESFLISRLTGGRVHVTDVVERIADAAPRHPPRRLGRRAARPDGGPGRAAPGSAQLVARSTAKRIRICSAVRSRSPAQRATSRRPPSARRASTPARRR